MRENNQNPDGLKPRELIEKARQYFFDFSYPIWTDDPKYSEFGDYRDFFETQFLKHFFKYQISYDMEDYDEYNLLVDETLNLIMPYYNQLFASETWFDKYIDNPSTNTDYKETYTRNIDTENTANVTSTSSSDSETQQNNENVTESTSNDTNSTTSNNTTEDNSESKTVSHAESGTTTKDSANDMPKNEVGEDYMFNYASTQSLSNAVATSDQTSTTTSSDTLTQESETGSETQSSSNSVDTNTLNATTTNTANTETEQSGTGNTLEQYEFRRVGNIGVQTPGEVFEHTRKAFINTLQMIYKDENIKLLFLQCYS